MINHWKNWISCKSVEDLTIFVHEESPVINNWPSKQLLQNEFLSILHHNEDLDNSVLQEIQISWILSRSLQDTTRFVLLDWKVVHDIMKSFFSNSLEVLDLLNTFHDKFLHSIIVFVDEGHQVTL